MTRKTTIAVSLLIAVVVWTLLLSLTSPTAAPAVVESTNSLGGKCLVKFVDKSKFSASATPGEVSLRMDILDPSGQPIVNLKDSNFEVIEEELPVRVTAFRGPQNQSVNVALVIDVSGSMADENRIEGARESAKVVLDSLKNDRDRLAIIPFADKHFVLRPLDVLTATSRSTLQESLQGLRAGGGTLIGPPTVEALKLFAERHTDGARIVLIMTDGEDDEFQTHFESISKSCEQVGAQVHTIGFGQAVPPSAVATLIDIANRCSGNYQFAPSNEELAKIFGSRVEETINESSLTYDSPYPEPDGLPRRATIRVKTPMGLIESTFNYQVGPILGGRSQPAPWAIQKGQSSPTDGAMSYALPITMFFVLLAILLAGLIVPEYLWSRDGVDAGALASAPHATAHSSQPFRTTVPLPPPRVARMATPTPPLPPASGAKVSAAPAPPAAPARVVPLNPAPSAKPPRPAAGAEPASPKPSPPPPPRRKST